MARLRTPRIEDVVDGVRLRSQLTAAALSAADEAEARRRALELLKGALFRGRMIAKERLEAGAGGSSTARLLSRVTDEVVQALYDFTTTHVFRARNPTAGERLAVAAVGGYGRGALAPFSDLDLLFLRPYKATAHTESVIEFMLYALWDLGFKVGHASRTVEECLKLARGDFTIRTTLLEARHLAGDEALTAELARRFREEVARGTEAEFTAAKLRERDERHARAGASRYLVEPNVKESKGGLRDLNTLFWIARYLHPADGRSGEVVRLEAFTGRELKAFLRAFDFLWAVRCHLHFAVGRAEERLSFDLQPEIARRMGYGAGPGAASGGDGRGVGSVGVEEAAAVERFMRRYFLIAREVGVLTRVFCAQLEEENAKAPPTGLSRFLPARRRPRRVLAPGFHVDGGRLAVAGEELFQEDPVALLRVFEVADQHDLDLHPDAFSAVSRSLALISPGLRADPEAAEIFLRVLARGRDPFRSLTLMNETGVLGRYLPEFGRIVCQMQFNMYHSYTVDEHTLRAVGVLAEARDERLDEAGAPLLGAVLPRIADVECLFLAMLLHDSGKGGEGTQEEAGGRVVRTVAPRLGFTPERVELCAWLVEHHLLMSDTAQKRDISDPETVAAFARQVETPERLRMLLAVTVADIRAVGPGVWNGWKAQLLHELHRAAEAVFRGGRGEDAAARVREVQFERAERARGRLLQAFGDVDDPGLRAWAASRDQAYLNAFRVPEQAMHYALWRHAHAAGGVAARAAPGASVEAAPDAAEVAVVARDRPGLFADLAGALSAEGADVLGARIYTEASGEVLDVFYVKDATGRPFGDGAPTALDRLARAVEAAARGQARTGEGERRGRSARAETFSVAAQVAVDQDASATATVVECTGADRPGLLEALARTVADAGLSVQSAHVETYGARAVDAFYLTDAATGAKLADADRVAALCTALREALRSKPVTRPRLARARASAGR